jgi:hypothetical protein
MRTHSQNKPKIKKKVCQKADGTSFLGQDKKGVVMVEFMQQGTTITSKMYCETLIKLSKAFQNKRRVMLIYGVMLLHDNAHPHTTARTRALQEHFDWELFDHPPYSPDLAPSDYHLFT